MTAPQPKPGILGIEAYVPGRAKLEGVPAHALMTV